MADIAAYVTCFGGHGHGIPACGSQPLTEAQYLAQMDRPDSAWHCPMCGGLAEFDDYKSEQLWEASPQGGEK